MQEKSEIQIGPALKEAWAIFLKAPEIFVVITFGSVAVSWAGNLIPGVGMLLTVIVASFMPSAFFLAANAAQRKEKISFADLEPLKSLAPQLLMLGVVRAILSSIGFFLLVLPGFYVLLALLFADLYVVQEGRSFLEAMKASHKLFRDNWLGVLGLGFFLGLLCFSGFLLAFIGALLTVPMAFITGYCVFQRMVRGVEVV